MSIEAGWYPVDETGHVPYVAAELPTGHEVYLDASGNIGAIRPMEQPIKADDEQPPEQAPDGQSAPDNDAAETPGQGG